MEHFRVVHKSGKVSHIVSSPINQIFDIISALLRVYQRFEQLSVTDTDYKMDIFEIIVCECKLS